MVVFFVLGGALAKLMQGHDDCGLRCGKCGCDAVMGTVVQSGEAERNKKSNMLCMRTSGDDGRMEWRFDVRSRQSPR